MSATPPPPHDAMLVDVPPARREPGEHAPSHRSTRAGRGRPGRGRRDRGGRYPPPQRLDEDADALGAFTRHRPRPHTAAQVIAEVTSNAATILAPVPAHPIPATDPGPDVEEIIAAAEQLDLEQASRMPDVTTEDVFGRLILISILIVNVLTLVLLSAAFASLGPSREN
ncbi:uncharacterized protein HD556DRAFT_1311267 [Suillus plorans]|uniref:Uncharacterized protein n=1 Tax=Suillus plorans TaxID=116603 RepID=A0A9P7DEB5_9AGAM|nr:uncharacterized protein HD556DRAFT_1311267 [Suillus plorans]KAG1789501.1 hypothetical protein HD556DRAFT_1311267 [Suillus plorans]